MMYEDVLKEMKQRMEDKEKRYLEWKQHRQQELMDVAREIDLKMDRRRTRRKHAAEG